MIDELHMPKPGHEVDALEIQKDCNHFHNKVSTLILHGHRFQVRHQHMPMPFGTTREVLVAKEDAYVDWINAQIVSKLF